MTSSVTGTAAMRILIVEDNAADAQLIVHAVRQLEAGVRVDVAATRERFSELVLENEYDIVLADYRLLGWTGMDALRTLRALGVDTPVVIVTGTLGDEPAVDCIKAGAADYVLKGNLKRLPLAITRALDEKRARDEARAAQEALEESVGRFQKLCQASFDAIVISQNGICREVNPEFVAMFGYERMDEVIHRPVTDFVAEEVVEELLQRLAAGTEGTYELLGRRRDGTRLLLEVTAGNHSRGGAPERITALRDMTERRALEDRFRQAQKMEAVGRLAGGVAHDFNNLLTVITINTEMLLADFGCDDPRRADLEEVRHAVDTAAGLTRQLLAFSRQQVIEPRVIVLQDVVKKIQQLLRRLIGEDIKLVTRLATERCVVHMDPGQLEQVIMNLAVNARDAMPTGGTLTIESAIVELDGRYAAAHWPATTGRFAMLSMSDTGIGMDAVTRARIFEPFFTTKELGTGTGLGLATVYGIVKQSGGFIWTYSEPGQGAAFKIYLPLHEEEPEPLREESVPPPALRGTETVLLVEDSQPVRDITQRALQERGYEVIAPSSAAAALQAAATLGRPIHLLLTDVVMPQMSGRVLAEQIAALQPGAKVLYMSGYTDDAVIRHGVLRAKMHFVQKPFSSATLATRVREILDS